MAGTPIHEKRKELSSEALDLHRAISSLVEELEAIDLYTQRVDVCKDEALKKILQHNSNEEKEHAAMLTEWIRRQDEDFDKELKNYVFKDEEIAH